LTKCVTTLDASGARVIGEVCIRRRAAAAGITITFSEIGKGNLPHHHEVLPIPAITVNIRLCHIDFGLKDEDF